MPPPQAILDLVARYEQHRETYISGSYNETQLRRDFLDPFFKGLGWDIDNTKNWAEAYREVIHEDAVRIDGTLKAPDYCFRIGGVRKFFLEAKKPSVDIKDETPPAYQLRRYGWNTKLPLSILSDFEEFAVYDTRIKPASGDPASTARTFYCTYLQYAEKWDEIASIFSPDAISNGSFDKYADANKKKRGTAEVDEDFLSSMESWRSDLARNIAARNPLLSQHELNFAVQRILDRIIFLRISEDRGLETYGRLQTLTTETRIYPRLCELFRQADDRYNSGLFHFKPEKGRNEPPDDLTLGLKVDDALLHGLLKGLYYPDSPYVFSVLSSDILGQVYEQFLGKVIRLTDGHHAKVEEKPEVRKAGGVYYTPTYIVDYIVRQTVGALLDGKALGKAPTLRVLDPACGSGSFLIGAYQHLLDWYLAHYVSLDPAKWAKGKKPAVVQTPNGWRLTITERKRILLDHIYGVDVDSQAVEVTKLSLLLKVLEGETSQDVQLELAQFRERALPDLDGNIKCGNSLIGSDNIAQLDFLDDQIRRQINPFNWEDEFKEVMDAGGFDVVLGNPPYLNIDAVWGKQDARLVAIKQAYPHIYNDKTDILFYFLAKAAVLSKGVTSFIVSRAFLEAYKADKLRGYLAQNVALDEVIDFRNFQVFDAGITTCIIRFQAKSKTKDFHAYHLQPAQLPSLNLSSLLLDSAVFEKIIAKRSSLGSAPWVFSSQEKSGINAKVDESGIPIGKILAIGQGMQTGCNSVFGERSETEIKDWGLKPGQFYKRATNSDIQRFFLKDQNQYLLYVEDASKFSDLPPGVRKHLEQHSGELRDRAAFKRGDCEWWKYTWPLSKDHYSNNRILCPYLADRNRFALDDKKKFLSLTDTTVLFDNGQPENLRYILGLLNSRLLTFRFQSIGKLKSGGILEYFWNSVSKLPIRRINLANQVEKDKHDIVVRLVERMERIQIDFSMAKTPDERTRFQREIDSADRQIDEVVYDLYGLTESEIAIVETKV